uniref:DUF2428 domain-containing protein n=1 Tax=Anopheles maculatus TaxID=74869 RepID=A0A182SR68_9DIPT
MWKNLLSYSDIRQAMISSDDSTRMSALYLITECHKSTEIFTKQDLECILFFLETNINVQAASLRQKITSCMKSALNRLRSGFLSIIKKSDIDGKSHYYYEFVKRLHEFCIVNQFIGANYSRRAISFQILLQLLQISSYIFYDDENISIWNERQVRILLSALNDSYESNKHFSLKVLSFCPKQFIKQFNGELNYEVTRTLMISPRPNDSLSAAYYLEYLWTFLEDFVETNLAECTDIEMDESNELPSQVEINNSSTQSVMNDELNEGCKPETTPQMILLCSWRTIKEISLILGDIASRSPIIETGSTVMQGENGGLLTCQQILSIGNQFIELLSETKHRGAFEQAYIGFSKICLRLWGSPHTELHQLPMRWIKELINAITGSMGTVATSTISDRDITEINLDKLYPVLYDYFVLELEKASKIIIQGTRSKKLHPLLLLLSRLYPSALEGSESNLKLSRFVPLVSICSGCAEFQTRYLAAKIVSIIVSPDLMFDRICLCQHIIIAEDDQFIDDLSNIVDYLLNLANHRSFYGEPLVFQKIVLLKTFMYLYSDDETGMRSSQCFLLRIESDGEARQSPEYIQAMLNTILLVLDVDHIGKHCEEYDITPVEVFYFRNICELKPDRLRWLKAELLRSHQFHSCLRRLIGPLNDGHNQPHMIQVKAYLVLSYSSAAVSNVLLDGKNIREAMQIIYKEANSQSYQLRSAMFRCLKQPLVATYAQSVYLRLLSKTMTAHKFTINQIITVIVVIWILKEQETEDDSVNIDDVTDIKVFDKNEVNIYGELELVRDYCIAEIQHLETSNANYSLESNIDKIQKIVDKHLKQPTCIREFLHSTAKISSKLIGIVL